MTPAPRGGAGREVLLNAVTEKQFQAQVEVWAKRAGWMTYHTRNSIGSAKGFPDCVLAEPRTAELIYAELKTERGKLSPSQELWIDTLRACGQRVYIWRPRDEAAVKAVLGL